MTTDELMARWAEKKWGLADVAKVDFDYTEGYEAYSTLTPGAPAEQWCTVTFKDGTTKIYSDLWLTTDLIREILAADSDALPPREAS